LEEYTIVDDLTHSAVYSFKTFICNKHTKLSLKMMG
jgi:hypothetical protein